VTHLAGVTVGDAEFSTDILLPADQFDKGPQARVQFRISDEGRYGLRLRWRPQRDGFVCEVDIYQFLLPEKKCSNNVADVAHCPLWPKALDLPKLTPLASTAFAGSPSEPIPVKVSCKGSVVTAVVAGHLVETDSAVELTAGRLGLYVFWPTPAPVAVPEPLLFTNIHATTDGLSASNFALLYSTVGYDLHRTSAPCCGHWRMSPATKSPPCAFRSMSSAPTATRFIPTRLLPNPCQMGVAPWVFKPGCAISRN
jgi:hypothetical protein